ncbi:7671_t:CDS:2 [Paraglomus occultum]|uniref:7671_t:CDS:1 n=1 Tax=Paraglomus occultum TaxID=144539 RepID=A0A9N9F9X6_9GLOM|nr:7671_t:CDS:2 [Paraglomus occultum]
MAIIFYKAKPNPMMFYFTLSSIALNVLTLLGFVYHFDWHTAPPALCYFQAIGVQFATLLTGICAFNFIIQVYRLLVLREHSEITNSSLISYYNGLMIAYPIIGTVIITLVAIKTNAIGVRDFKCDIVSPIWVRLLGYNGINLLVSIPGTYFSAHTTIIVTRYLDRFKTSSANTQGHAPMIESKNAAKTVTEDSESSFPRRSHNSHVTSSSNKSYNITRTAAIRMVFFTVIYLITNISASIETIVFVMAGKPLDSHPGGSDIVLVSLGVILFLIFGTADDVRKWTIEKLKIFKPKRRLSDRQLDW